ncbi:MAG TPA: SDR family oxidoreductase [Patescibacteria group bacterium]|nr:SDR family oxidoreductase [Patescibacteria group bacterium]
MKKVVLISGGSDGLGKAIAQNLTHEYRVVILSPTEEKLKKVAGEIGVDYIVADVTDYESLEKAVKRVVDKFKRIDCLVNNAGLWIQGELVDNNSEDIRKVINVNTLGAVYFSKAVIPQMKKQKNGLIININSQAGLYAKQERAVYNATKWGMTGFTKALQEEVAKYGISVTGIHPGKMNTKMFEKMGIQKDMGDAIDPKEVARIVRFLLETPGGINFPEIGIKSLDY